MKDNQDSNSEVWEIDALKDSLGVNFVGIGNCMENMMRRERFKTDEKVLAYLALILSSSPGAACGYWLVKACVYMYAFKSLSTFHLIEHGLYPSFPDSAFLTNFPY